MSMNKNAQVGSAPPKPLPEPTIPKPQSEEKSGAKPTVSTHFFPSHIPVVQNMQQKLIDLSQSIHKETENSPIIQNLLSRNTVAEDDRHFSTLSKLVNSLQTIGRQTADGTKNIPDGVWGGKTQAGLENSVKLFGGIADLAERLQSPLAEKIREETTDLHQAINQERKTSNIPELSKTISRKLDSLTEYTTSFFNLIKSNSYITNPSQELSLNGAPKALNVAAQRLIQNNSEDLIPLNIPQDLQTNTGTTYQLKLSDLIPENFLKFIKDHNIEVGGNEVANNPSSLQLILNFLKNQVDKLPDDKKAPSILQENR